MAPTRRFSRFRGRVLCLVAGFAVSVCALDARAGYAYYRCRTSLLTLDGRHVLITPACDVEAALDLTDGRVLKSREELEPLRRAPAVPLRPIARLRPPLDAELVRELTREPGSEYAWDVFRLPGSGWIVRYLVNLGGEEEEQPSFGGRVQLAPLATFRAKILTEQALGAHGRKRFAEAIRLYREALGHDPSYPRARYNLACALAKTGQLDAALEELVTVVGHEPSLRPTALTDRDFRPLRERERFRRLLAGASGPRVKTSDLPLTRERPPVQPLVPADEPLPDMSAVITREAEDRYRYDPAGFARLVPSFAHFGAHAVLRYFPGGMYGGNDGWRAYVVPPAGFWATIGLDRVKFRLQKRRARLEPEDEPWRIYAGLREGAEVTIVTHNPDRRTVLVPIGGTSAATSAESPPAPPAATAGAAPSVGLGRAWLACLAPSCFALTGLPAVSADGTRVAVPIPVPGYTIGVRDEHAEEEKFISHHELLLAVRGLPDLDEIETLPLSAEDDYEAYGAARAGPCGPGSPERRRGESCERSEDLEEELDREVGARLRTRIAAANRVLGATSYRPMAPSSGLRLVSAPEAIDDALPVLVVRLVDEASGRERFRTEIEIPCGDDDPTSCPAQQVDAWLTPGGKQVLVRAVFATDDHRDGGYVLAVGPLAP